MPEGKLIAIVTTETRIYCAVRPPVPQFPIITFRRIDMALFGTVSLPPSTDTGLLKRPVTIAINGNAPSTVDCMTPQDFPCNEGDSVVATPTGDVNAVGPGPAGPSTTATATTEQGVPPAPGAPVLSFRAA